jgi:hypothetical protein
MCLSPFPGRKLIPNKDLPDKKDVILSECKEKGIFGSNTLVQVAQMILK